MGIDHNTKETGVSVVEFGIDEAAYEQVEIRYADVPIQIKGSMPLQERLFYFCEFIRSNLIPLIAKYRPDYIVRERHNPNGPSSNELYMLSGILDAIMFEQGYSFKSGNYKQITPVEWKVITLLKPYHEMKKNTKKEKTAYCQLFKNLFPQKEIQEATSSDVVDSFGLAYSMGVRYWAEQDEDFLEALHEEQARIVKKDGRFKKWD